MFDLIFYTLYCAPFVILFLYKHNKVPHVLRISCANTLVLFYILVNHVGLWALYHSDGEINYLPLVNKDTVILLSLYSLIVTMCYIISGSLFGINRKGYRSILKRAIKNEELNKYVFVYMAIFAFVVAIAKFLDDSALSLLLIGDTSAALTARVEGIADDRRLFGVNASYVDVVFRLAGFISIIVLVKLLVEKNLKYALLYIALISATVLYFFSSTSKGIFVSVIYGIAFAYSFVYKQGVVINRLVVWLAAAGLLISALVTTWVLEHGEVSLLYPIYRLFLGNLVPQYTVVDHFDFSNLLYGVSVPSWFSFGMHEQFVIEIWTWKELMNWEFNTAFYSAPSSFVSEAHANFHIGGVIIVSMVVFVSLRAIDLLFRSIRSDTLYAAIVIYSSLHFAYMSATGAVRYIVDYGYWAVILCLYLLHIKYRSSHSTLEQIN
jgi:hypothetical protein